MNNKVDLNLLVQLSSTKDFNIDRYLNITTYLPFAKKVKYANIFVEHIIDENGNYDSMDRYFKFTMMIFNIYTNLKLNNTYEEYDKLVNSGLIDIIFSKIEPDYYEMKEFVNMRIDDKLREIYSKKN